MHEKNNSNEIKILGSKSNWKDHLKDQIHMKIKSWGCLNFRYWENLPGHVFWQNKMSGRKRFKLCMRTIPFLYLFCSCKTVEKKMISPPATDCTRVIVQFYRLTHPHEGFRLLGEWVFLSNHYLKIGTLQLWLAVYLLISNRFWIQCPPTPPPSLVAKQG